MEKKSERFELRLSLSELKALETLASHRGVSKASIVAGLIRKEAMRRKLW